MPTTVKIPIKVKPNQDILQYIGANYLESNPSRPAPPSKDAADTANKGHTARPPSSNGNKKVIKKAAIKISSKPTNSSRAVIKRCLVNNKYNAEDAKALSKNMSYKMPPESVNRSCIMSLKRPNNGQALFSTKADSSTLRLSPAKNVKQELIQNLLQLLGTERAKSTKARSTTPNSGGLRHRTQRQQQALQHQILLSRAYTPSTRAYRVNMKKPQDKQYETMGHTFLIKSNNNASPTHNKSTERVLSEDPYKLIGGLGNSRNRNIPLNNMIAHTVGEYSTRLKPAPPSFPKKDENAKKWRRHMEESTDNGSTSTNKSTLLVGAVALTGEDKDDDLISEDRLTVVENDCDNNYDLIFKSLQGEQYQL